MALTVCSPSDLVTHAAKLNVAMSQSEAQMVLGYLEGSAYALMQDGNGTLSMCDNCDPGFEGIADISLTDVLDLAASLNFNLLSEETAKENGDPDRTKALDKDYATLKLLTQAAGSKFEL